MDEKTIPLSKLPVDVKVQTSGKNKLGAELDYRALFEQTGECVFIIGLDFKFITANQQALQLLGYEEYQLTGIACGGDHAACKILTSRKFCLRSV